MRDSLDRSILRAILSYAALQAGIYAAFSLPSGFFARYAPAFFASCLGFHAFLYILLKSFKADFALADGGRPLDRINLANFITLFRVSSLPTLLFLVIASRHYRIAIPLLIMVFIVFASDLVDGWVSRSTGQVTRIGKLMDSASDYLVLVVLTIVFYYFQKIDIWFFVLVIGRLGIQALFMAILFLRFGKLEPRTTFMGKAAIASIMVLYGIQILEMIVPVGLFEALKWIEWIAGVVVGLSIFDKVVAFAKDLRVGKDASERGE